MATPAAGRGLHTVLRVMSLVMVVAGAATIVLGIDSIAGAGEASSAIDSELRFYAVWYVVTGLVLWRASADVARETWLIRVIALAFFVAGCSRGVSWLVAGRPHWSQVVLMIVELVIPFVVVPWQAVVARARGA